MRYITWARKVTLQYHLKALNTQPDAVGMGALRVLESIRVAGLEKKKRYYQASTSELYGDVQEIPQTENNNPFIRVHLMQ